MARIVGEYSEVLKRSDLSSAFYSASLIDPIFPDRFTLIPGHENVSLDLETVFFNALRTDQSWDLDADGFNFRHIPDISEKPLFEESRRFYQLDYVFNLKDSSRLPARVIFRILTH
ncbi:MAG: hypothetical protein Q4D17_04500 [Planctomycetia bacterium]|nr:hypothetical protein [Planctomycetia bacterium]